MNTYFVDLFAWGPEDRVQSAIRKVRQQLRALNDEGMGLTHMGRTHITKVGLDQLFNLPTGAIARVLPLVVDIRDLTPVIDHLWSAPFIARGGTMALVALDLASPTPSVGWINAGGVVLRQGWDVPAVDLPSTNKHGLLKIEGPHGADQMGEKLMAQFLALRPIQSHTSRLAQAA